MLIHGGSSFFFFQAEDGIRDLVRSRGLGDVYKRQPERRARDKAILELLFSTGLRVSELCSLTNDLDLKLSLIHI